MSLTIEQIHDRILLIAKKNQWGYLSHEQVDMFLDMAQMELYEEYYGDIERYQPGRPVPVIGYDQTKKTAESLGRFIETITINSTNAPNGTIAYPSDFRSYIDSYIVPTSSSDGDAIGLDFTSQGQKAFSINSQLLPISSEKSAFICIEDGAFQIYPKKNYTGGEFRYLRLPAKPEFAYTQSGRTITYNSSGSTQLEWGDDDVHKIILKAMSYLSMTTEDDRLFNQSSVKDRQ